MRLISNKPLLTLMLAAALTGCSAQDAAQSEANDTADVALSDVPAEVSQVVMQQSPDFKMSEVLKKRREGRIYYDVEGELPNGDEIEFDVLMTETGPKVVEIQRDIAWDATPQKVRETAEKANTDKQAVVRVIESKQAGSDVIIYEIFVEGQAADPRFEVSVSGDGPAKLLTERAKH